MELSFLKPAKKEKETFFESLQNIEGVEVKQGANERDTYELISENEKSVTTAFITIQDSDCNSDIAFKAIRTQPKPGFSVNEVRGKGEGSALVQKIINWGKSQGLKTVTAVGVQFPEAREFWRRNDFVFNENPDNIFEEWIYQPLD